MLDEKSRDAALSLWYKPRQAMQGLIEEGRGHGVAMLVALLFGAVQSVPFYLRPDSLGFPVLLAGALAGLAGLYLFAWLLRNFGRWFGGGGALREVRTALGWAQIPWLLLFFVLFALLHASDREQLAQYYALFFLALLYGYVLLLLCLSVALRLSVLKTFLCLIVTIAVSLFPLTLLLQILTGGPTGGPSSAP